MIPTIRPKPASDTSDHRVRRALPAIATSLLVLLGPSACGLLDPDTGKVPDEARVSVDGTSSDDLELVVSNDFVRRADEPGSDLVSADTAFVAPGFEDGYGFGAKRRFLVRLGNPDSAEVDVTLRVFFDDDLRYERQSDLTEETLEFSFIFR